MLLVLVLVLLFRHPCDGLSNSILFPSEDRASPFILDEEPQQAVKTEWGEIRVHLQASVLKKLNVGLGFITMQPRSLLIPHYLDASFVLLVHQGSARLGLVAEHGFVQQNLKAGDVYAIPAGTVFYILSTNDQEDLTVYGMYDMLDFFESGKLESFYVSGGYNPRTVFSGFGTDVLEAAFKVPSEAIFEFLSEQSKGAIVPTSMEIYTKLTALDRWSWKNAILNLVHGKQLEAHKSMSIYSKKHLFENRNGWFASTYGKKLPGLKKSRAGVLAANLTTGALLAPHWHPQASVVGIVTKGSGTIQIAYPNGTNAVNQRVEQGSIFVVPRYFPACEIASGDGSFEFVGFTVADRFHKHGHHPQFLTGRSSVLDEIDVETLALSFNMPEVILSSILTAQQDKIILSGQQLYSRTE